MLSLFFDALLAFKLLCYFLFLFFGLCFCACLMWLGAGWEVAFKIQTFLGHLSSHFSFFIQLKLEAEAANTNQP